MKDFKNQIHGWIVDRVKSVVLEKNFIKQKVVFY